MPSPALPVVDVIHFIYPHVVNERALCFFRWLVYIIYITPRKNNMRSIIRHGGLLRTKREGARDIYIYSESPFCLGGSYCGVWGREQTG